MAEEKKWLSGAAQFTVTEQATKIILTVILWLREPDTVDVQVCLLDRHRFEPRSPVGSRKGRPAQTAKVDVATPAIRKCDGQVLRGLGGDRLFRGVCRLEFPKLALQKSSYLGFEIQRRGSPQSPAPARSVDRVNGKRDEIYLEIGKKQLDMGRQKAPLPLRWLLTHRGANSRFMAIAEKLGLFDLDDETATDALTNLLLAVYSGDDGPLLTEFLEDNDE